VRFAPADNKCKLIGISDFNSISAQNHTPAALSRQTQIALATVAGPHSSDISALGL
jgi:hypothetical protein